MVFVFRALKRICCISSTALITFRRCTTRTPCLDKEVLFHTQGNCGIITLNRPKVLNAVTLNMIERMHCFVNDCENDPNICLVIARGSGAKAFCTGGDVTALTGERGTSEFLQKLCKEAYQYILQIANLKTPFLTLMEGVTMGFGAALSLPGRYSIATETTLFAMPETAIGFFPDAGCAFFFFRLRNSLGMLLGLAGYRLKGRDNFHAGTSSHYVTTKELPYLYNELCKMTNPSDVQIKNLLDMYHGKCEDKEEGFSLEKNLDIIDFAFSADTVEDVFERLREEGSIWSLRLLHTLQRMCPVSIKIAHRHIREAGKLDLKGVLEMDYRICQHVRSHGYNLDEGVRAVLIDRDNSPSWHPKYIEDVSDEMVASHFKHLLPGKELVLTK